jgi:hypothetical protein
VRYVINYSQPIDLTLISSMTRLSLQLEY